MTQTQDFFTISTMVRGLIENRKEFQFSESTLFEFVLDTLRIVEKFTDKIRTEKQYRPNIQCKKGCSFCCHMRICVTAPEVLFARQHIITNHPQNSIPSLIDRLREIVSDHAIPSDEEYGNAGIVCPLLKNNECSIYDSRPIECRAYDSVNLIACKLARENYSNWNVPIDYDKFAIHKCAQAGMLAVLSELGYEPELLELNRALLAALEHHAPVVSWINKEPIFERARIPVEDYDYQAIQPWSPMFQDWITS